MSASRQTRTASARSSRMSSSRNGNECGNAKGFPKEIKRCQTISPASAVERMRKNRGLENKPLDRLEAPDSTVYLRHDSSAMCGISPEVEALDPNERPIEFQHNLRLVVVASAKSC